MKLKSFLLVILAFLSFALIGCGDQKAPEKGYISEEKLEDDIISLFESQSSYSKVAYTGSMNFLAIVSDRIDDEVDFTDSTDVYSVDSSSYYLQVPLHITPENWFTEAVADDKLPASTKYRLQDKIHRTLGLDEIYYYERTDGGFYDKAFAVNKPLIIDKNNNNITMRAKWNITIEYDKNGYLVSEFFETINAHHDPDSKSCYGSATYTFR